MSKLRLEFEKNSRAVYISHLDLMRTFQRAFLRAKIDIKNSEGFNPHQKISIVLPLSLGQSSCCELMDFEVIGENCDYSDYAERMNKALPEGIRVKRVYEPKRKGADIAYISCKVRLVYDRPTENLRAAVEESLARDSITVQKKSKRGMTDFDIVPCIKKCEVKEEDGMISIYAVVTAQNPTMNPELFAKAVLPEPNFYTVERLELLDKSGRKFE